MKKLQNAINQLQQLAKSRYKETKRIAKELLTACSQTTKLTKRLERKIEVLQARDEQRKNSQLIKKEAKAATIINAVQLTTNVEAPTPEKANEILSQKMCLINYKLVKDSKTTGEKAGTLTTRIASRMPEVWNEYDRKTKGLRRQNGTIIYKDLKMRPRSCAEDNLVWIYELSDELSAIFRAADEPMQIFYGKLFTKELEKVQKIFNKNKVFC